MTVKTLPEMLRPLELPTKGGQKAIALSLQLERFSFDTPISNPPTVETVLTFTKAVLSTDDDTFLDADKRFVNNGCIVLE